MKRYLLLSLLIIISIASSARTITGYVIDKSSNESLPYVNIGIIGKSIGTVSNARGYFKLTIPNNLTNEKIRFSFIGYHSVTMDILEISKKKNITVFLKEKVTLLQEVVIKPIELKTKVLGGVAKSGPVTTVLRFSSSVLGTEICRLIRVKKRSFVESFNFNLTTNEFDTLTFRLNFYGLDDEKNPSDSLIAKSYIFSINNDTIGEFNINIKEQNIVVEENFFLSLEVIDGFAIEGTENRIIEFAVNFGGNAYARFTSQAYWETIPVITPAFNIKVQQEQ